MSADKAGPTPQAVQAARSRAGHSQTTAAELLGAKLRTWQSWEAGERQMAWPAWQLYLLLTGQHPDQVLVDRAKA